VDEGGVAKEFFQLLTAELFDQQYGMFIPVADSSAVWFNKDCSWSGPMEYSLVGMLVGLAVYNSILLDVSLPMVLFKKLLGCRLSLEDVSSIDAELYKGLRALLTYEPASDVQYVFCRTFEVTWDYLGSTKRWELLPDGANIDVTGENREDFVNRYVNWLLTDSVKRQFDEFHSGFKRVVGAGSISLFRPSELELLVCGSSALDFGELEKTTQYIGGAPGDGWSRDHPTIKYFWNVVHSFSREEKQKLLFFFTGTMKAPLGGLAAINMKIQRMGPDTGQLPTTHTCFNTILLPEYNSEATLRTKLLQAMTETEGFGLR
jgi:ubiquitin-protein ligase E3 A